MESVDQTRTWPSAESVMCQRQCSSSRREGMKLRAYLHQLSQALSRRGKHGSCRPRSPSVRLIQNKPNISIASAKREGGLQVASAPLWLSQAGLMSFMLRGLMKLSYHHRWVEDDGVNWSSGGWLARLRKGEKSAVNKSWSC